MPQSFVLFSNSKYIFSDFQNVVSAQFLLVYIVPFSCCTIFKIFECEALYTYIQLNELYVEE